MGNHMVVLRKQWDGTTIPYPNAPFFLEPTEDAVFASASNAGFFVAPGMKLVGAMVTGSATYIKSSTNHIGQPVTRASIVTPSTMTTFPPSITPVAAVPGGTQTPIQWLLHNPIALNQNDVLQVQVECLTPPSGVTTVGPGWVAAVLWLQDEFDVVPLGGVFWMSSQQKIASGRASGFAWETEGLENLPSIAPGRYAVVGYWAQAPELLASRIQLPGVLYRPGSAGISTPSAFTNEDGDVTLGAFSSIQPNLMFMNAGLGLLGELDSYTPPQLQFLFWKTQTADVYVNINLAVIKIR